VFPFAYRLSPAPRWCGVPAVPFRFNRRSRVHACRQRVPVISLPHRNQNMPSISGSYLICSRAQRCPRGHVGSPETGPSTFPRSLRCA
jgi:hypothetical protein